MSSRSAKSCLFEYCQKRKIGPPVFETWAAANGYQAKVIIDGYPYRASAVYSRKKDAEHDAADACLASLGIFEVGTGSKSNQQWGNERYDEGQGYLEDDHHFGFPSPHFATPSPLSNVSTPSQQSFITPPRNSRSSGGDVKMPKSVLHEYCQWQKLPLPEYETEGSYDRNVLLGFHCVLSVRDEYFTTDHLYKNKREAEHAVARKALNVFGYYERSPLITGHTPTHIPPGTPSFKTPETSYKNLLQEHLQQRSIEAAEYETQLTEAGYFSKVTIEGTTFEAEESCTNKKMAEQCAARAGLVGMGIKDPEAVATRLLQKNSRGRFIWDGDIPYRKDLRDLEPDQFETEQVQGSTSWVHSRKQSDFDVDDYDDIDGEFTDFQKAGPIQVKRKLNQSVDGNDDFFGMPEQSPCKMQRFGEGSYDNSRSSLERRQKKRGEFEMEDVHLGNLSVGETWPERRNIVIVGSEETSIPLFCQADMDRCALQDASAGQLVDIVPGDRLVGLKGYYVVRGGQIVLKAKECQQVVTPEVPDKVLISCGIVVLHCIPRREWNETSCDVNVLLKRYLCSQAFINVVRGLAQYFRWKQSGRSFTLDKNLMVAHIRDWMLEEVMAIASLSENALENVFQHTMRFDKRWAKFLRSEELSQELKDIQAAANKELFRRANSGEDQSQDRFRPWQLPKGNFYHRVLTTGVFIESPPEAAMRELKEETGIKLKLSDVTSSPYVDVPQTDNLNPHKGDFARYYLCGIITEAEDCEEEIEEEQVEEECTVDNPDVCSATADTVLTNTGPSFGDTESSTNYASTGVTPAVTNSTYNAAYSTNAAGYLANTGSAGSSTNSINASTGGTGTATNSMYATGSGYTSYSNAGAYGSTGAFYTDTNTSHPGTNSADMGTRSTYGSAYSAYMDAYSAQANTGPTYPNTQSNVGNTNSGYSGTGPSYGEPSSANVLPGSTNTGSYSAFTPRGSNTNLGSTPAYFGTASNTDRISALHSGAYSAHADLYSSSQTNTVSSNTSTNFSQTNTLLTTPSTNKTQPDASSTNADAGSLHHGAYSAYMDPPYISTNSTYAKTEPCAPGTNLTSVKTEPYAPGTNSTSVKTEPYAPGTNSTSVKTEPCAPGTNLTSAKTEPGTSADQTPSAQKDTTDKIKTEKDVNIKSEKEEDSTLIRSPLVAGALHEECKWLDIEEAKEISQIFNDIHNSPQFQRLIAKLKGIVSAM